MARNMKKHGAPRVDLRPIIAKSESQKRQRALTSNVLIIVCCDDVATGLSIQPQAMAAIADGWIRRGIIIEGVTQRIEIERGHAIIIVK